MREDKVEGADVLIIAYDCVLRDILTRMLTPQGYRVVNRSIGFHGIRTFQKGKGKFDIVVIDSQLPDMSGLDVAKKIKQISRATPTMLLRGWRERYVEEQLADGGVDIALSKPLLIDKACELIKNAAASRYK